MAVRLRFDDRLQAATAHPGTVTELMGARLCFDDRLQAATAYPGTVTELIGSKAAVW
jgi:hypothetical protein